MDDAPQPAVELLADPADVLGWSPGSPYLTSDVDPGSVLHAVEAVGGNGQAAAIGFVRAPSGDRDKPWVTAMGPDDLVDLVVNDLLDRFGDTTHDGLIGGATIPASGHDVLRRSLAGRPDPLEWGGPDHGAPWDWWWTDSVVEPAAPRHVVRWLDSDVPAVADAIRALLAVASPTHWAPPEHPHVTRWAGIVDDGADGSGAVLACVAETLRIPGRPHLASVATHPDRRGQGMAAEVTGWITARLLAEGSPLVSLGMYAHNDVARRVYTRLGYTCACSWFSSGFASMPASAR